MRIRKRPMLPFFSISPPPQIAPDLPQEEKQMRLFRAREKLKEEEEDDQGAEAKERGSGFDPTTHHSRNRSHEEMKKRCCMVSTPIPKQVEAMEVKGEEREHDEDDEKWTPRDMSSKRNGGMNCGSAETSSRPPSSSPEEGENAFPFKKRKARHYQWPKEKRMKTKLKRSNTPKKLDAKEDESGGDDANCVKSNGSAVLMEGSRCSRVNGRGWRCCQQTLVGYSLCEHHLGKGRLRSMSSVRSRASSTLDNSRDHEEEYQEGLSSSSPSKILMHEPQVDDQEEEEDHEKLTSMVMNKKKKMMIILNNKKKRSGVVKARSISSLLGQTHHATTPTLLPSNALV